MFDPNEKIILKPIGVTHVNVSDQEIKEANKEIEGIVEIFSEFEQALEGLDGFSHLFILSYFHRLRPEQIGPLKVKPKRATRRGFKIEEIPTLGVFTLDSPTRPNPIGLTLVQLLKICRRELHVSGIDLFDGTPILDIKPCQPDYQLDKYNVPEWYLKLMDRKGHV